LIAIRKKSKFQAFITFEVEHIFRLDDTGCIWLEYRYSGFLFLFGPSSTAMEKYRRHRRRLAW